MLYKNHLNLGFYLKTRYILALSIVLELILFYFYYFPEHKILFGDEGRYLNTGLSIVSGSDWHNNPLWPPMQSLLIALFVKIFQNPIFPLQVFQYGLLLLSGFIVRDIVYRETHNNTSAQLSFAVMTLYPSWLAYTQYLWPEVAHVSLFVSILWVNSYKGNSYKWLLFSGVLLGIAIQFKSLLILFIPFLYLSTFVNNGVKKSLGKVVLSIIMAAVIMVPASMKAHEMTGGWMVSNSAMFNLWFGLNDDTRQNFSHDQGGVIYKDYMKSAKTFEQRNNIFKERSLKKIHDDGYINTLKQQLTKQYFRLFDYQSFFSQQFQGQRENNYLGKYHHNHNEILVKIILVYNNIFYFLIMSAMIAGVMVSIKHSVVAKQLALFLLYALGLFVLLHTKPRFRIPLVPVMAFGTGYLWYYLKNNQFNFNNILGNKKNVTISGIVLTGVVLLLFSSKLLDKYFPI